MVKHVFSNKRKAVSWRKTYAKRSPVVKGTNKKGYVVRTKGKGATRFHFK